MKKYKVVFTRDYHPERDKGNTEFEKFFNKWNGQYITLQEVENNISELELIIFNGRRIEIYNDHRE